jgi:membrane-associated phospholipid phosphatase
VEGVRTHWRRVVVPAAFAVAFGVLAWVVVGHAVPYGADSGPHRWLVEHRSAAGVDVARGITAVGTGPYPYLAAVLGGWLAGGRTLRGGLRVAVVAGVVLLAGQSLRTLLVVWLHRARPPAADFAAHATSYSFPSGHTASSAVAAGLLGWGLLRAWPNARGRIFAGLAALVALAVGGTRVYLGVHWPSDVLGGWLFAGVWLGALLPPLDRYADRVSPGPPRGDGDGSGAGDEDEGQIFTP